MTVGIPAPSWSSRPADVTMSRRDGAVGTGRHGRETMRLGWASVRECPLSARLAQFVARDERPVFVGGWASHDDSLHCARGLMDLRSVTPSDSTVASPNGERLDGTSG